ncbi:MAG: HAMP domain-containing sensor histidine kinase [Patescibacteria group bacterium]
MDTINLFKIFLGSLLGLLIGLLTIQLLSYFQDGNMMNILEGMRFNNLKIEDLLIVLYGEIVGVMGGLFFAFGDSLKTQRAQILSLREEGGKKDKLLGFAAHALRTPATSFKWALYSILEGDYGALAKEQKRIFNELYHNVETLISLVEDYVDISKFELRRLEVSLKKVDVGSVEAETRKGVEAQHNLAEAKKVKMSYASLISQTQKKQFVLIDVPRLMRVVENLVENAIDYTEKGGNVHVETSILNGIFCFRISDSGIGIQKEDRAKIFSEFFRSSSARRLKSTGSGIGLFLASMVIKAHRGKIWFDSEENKGATFYFQIPLHQQTSEETLEGFLRKV